MGVVCCRADGSATEGPGGPGGEVAERHILPMFEEKVLSLSPKLAARAPSKTPAWPSRVRILFVRHAQEEEGDGVPFEPTPSQATCPEEDGEAGGYSSMLHSRTLSSTGSIPGSAASEQVHAGSASTPRSGGPGRDDPDISALGALQARCLARQLWRVEDDHGIAVVCSPSRSCLQTALPLAQAPVDQPRCAPGGPAEGRAPLVRAVVCHALLCEHGSDPQDFAQGAIAEEFPTLLGDSAQHHVRFEGFSRNARGYRYRTTKTQGRVEAFVEWLSRSYEEFHAGGGAAIVVLSHKAVLDCVLQTILDGSAGTLWQCDLPKYPFQHTGLTEVVADRARVAVIRLNDAHHLEA